MKAAKARKPVLGSKPASPEVAAAMLRLIHVRAAQASMKQESKELRAAIMRGGGGTAHGYRAYVARVCAGSYYRVVKAHDELKLVRLPDASTPSAD